MERTSLFYDDLKKKAVKQKKQTLTYVLINAKTLFDVSV